jgi:hypothetical protein
MNKIHRYLILLYSKMLGNSIVLRLSMQPIVIGSESFRLKGADRDRKSGVLGVFNENCELPIALYPPF